MLEYGKIKLRIATTGISMTNTCTMPPITQMLQEHADVIYIVTYIHYSFCITIVVISCM